MCDALFCSFCPRRESLHSDPSNFSFALVDKLRKKLTRIIRCYISFSCLFRLRNRSFFATRKNARFFFVIAKYQMPVELFNFLRMSKRRNVLLFPLPARKQYPPSVRLLAKYLLPGIIKIIVFFCEFWIRRVVLSLHSPSTTQPLAFCSTEQ